MIQTDPGSLINVFGGALLILLGAFVLWVAPRRTVNRAFAAFSVGFGVWAVGWNLPERVDPLFSWLNLFSTVGFALSAFGLIVLALRYPVPVGRKDRHKALVSAAVALPMLGSWTLLAVLHNDRRQAAFGFPESAYAVALWNEIAGGVFMFAVLFLVILYGLRYPSASPGARFQFALVAGAVVIWPAVINASFTFFDDGVSHVRSPIFIGTLFVAAVVWLTNMRVHHSGHARAVAWTLLAAPLAGLALAVGLGGWSLLVQHGVFGVARTITVAVFAYAILRHQLLGIDIKVKWTLKQSTVAAVFLAVIFVASEGAQIVFGDERAWVGLLAGGVLVFALAPLQRFAERVSDAAMPNVQDTEHHRRERALAIYRAAVESATFDGIVTERERDVLATLADELELTAKEALAIERDAARASA